MILFSAFCCLAALPTRAPHHVKQLVFSRDRAASEVRLCEFELACERFLVAHWDETVTAVRSHTQCRQQQKAGNDVTMMCKKVMSAAETNRTLLCERNSLGFTNDLVPLCKPAVNNHWVCGWKTGRSLFNTRKVEWKKDCAVCQNAEVALRTQAAECSVAEGNFAQQAQLCGGDLDSLESFSRSWATGFGARCSSYESCFASALTRHSDAVREAEASVVRWRKSWLAVARMECMAKTIDGSGAVDQAKMHACNDKNITDMSFLNITIEKPPSKAVCPTPEIYPESTLYREEVYGKLPAGLSVRQPTLCPLLLYSTVELEKLHRDVPIWGTTDITTYNNTLYMSGVRAFDMTASIGFGGFCFQKDILNLVYICNSLAFTKWRSTGNRLWT